MFYSKAQSNTSSLRTSAKSSVKNSYAQNNSNSSS